MPARVRAHLRGNLIAYLALFVALGGTASAAVIASKNSVNSKSIVNGQVRKPDVGKNAVTGAKIAGDTVTGADVKESSLGQVPSAATAGIAGNAGLLGGSPASAFAAAGKVLTAGRVAMVGNQAQKTLITNGTVSLLANCPSGPGGDRPSLTVKTAAGTTALFTATATNPATTNGSLPDGGEVEIQSFSTFPLSGTYNVVASNGKTLVGTFLSRGGFQGDGCIFSASAIAG